MENWEDETFLYKMGSETGIVHFLDPGSEEDEGGGIIQSLKWNAKVKVFIGFHENSLRFGEPGSLQGWIFLRQSFHAELLFGELFCI